MRYLIQIALIGILLVSNRAIAEMMTDDLVDGLVTRQSAHSFDATMDKYEAALKARGFMIFARLDHAAAAKSVDLKMPRETVIVFGNPRAGTPAFLKKPTLAIDLPLKALVWESAEGKVFLSYNSAEYVFGTLFKRHGKSYNKESAAKLETALKAIAGQAVK